MVGITLLVLVTVLVLMSFVIISRSVHDLRADRAWKQARAADVARQIEVAELQRTLDVEALIERVSMRRNNPSGNSEADQNQIRHHVIAVEPLLRARAMQELDGRRPVADLADEIERLIVEVDGEP